MRLLTFCAILSVLVVPTFAHDFSDVDAVIDGAVARKEIPGAVLVVGFKGKTAYRKVYGNRALVPSVEPMTEDTVFDAASLTKLFTATAVMDLVGKGKVRLNDPVSRYLPEFEQNGKRDITIRMLLTHYSGLAPDLDLTQPWQGKDEAFRRCMESTPTAPPGARFIYSDINFEVLGFLLEKLNNESLERVIERVVLKPLDMSHSRFLPPDEWRPKIAPTAMDENGNLLRGVVHDPTARRMGGVAGHAGLFTTAGDLTKFAKAILSREKILTPLLITKMTTPQQPAWSNDLRGLGWDIASPFANVRGDLLPAQSFGHTGYTGTSLWIDPASRSFIILLTNSVHPIDQPDSWARIAVRGKVANAVVTSLASSIDDAIDKSGERITSATETMAGVISRLDRNAHTLTGIDVLEAENFASLRGKKIGLLTNQTGVDRAGTRTIEVLAHAPEVKLVKLFSVEHGISGNKDDENINDRLDAKTGLPVEGVYGASPSSRRPSDAQLSGIDTLVIDIQDLGVRFYTYEASMAEFMTAAAANNVDVVILDRPNPLNGVAVQGPITDADNLWPNFNMPVPLRHGMTLGELAQMINVERKIGAKLRVVAMQGWSRADWFDSTGLAWINPSPNMRSLNAAMLYPGVAQLEAQGSNVSVGRGTETPFEIIGAPWISLTSAMQLAEYLNAREIPGVRFVPRQFTPTSYIFADEVCGGLNLIVTNRERLDSPLLGAELVSALQKFFPNDFHPDSNRKLVGNVMILDALKAGKDAKAVAIEWQDAIESFKQTRAKYLIYK